jgi:hypothetical protein
MCQTCLQSPIQFHPKGRLDVDDLSVGTGRCGGPSVCVDSYSFEPRADAEWQIHDGHHLGVDAAAVVMRVNRVLDELSLVRYVTARTERRNISISTALFALCGVTMNPFQINP